MQKRTKLYLYGLLGNVFDHYELALYGLLAPVFANLFFPDDKQVTSYIKSYLVFPLFLFSRLLGAWYFGKIGDRKGVSLALSQTLLGMASVAFLIGMVPIIQTKSFVPYLFFSLLILQNFFASGEKIGGALYILENSNAKEKPIISSIYDGSSILGYILANFCIILLGDGVNIYWHYLYIFSSVSAFFGFLIRKNTAVVACERKKSLKIERVNYKSQLSIVFIVSFSYALYYITMTLMNSWIPLITTISYARVLHMNIYLLLLDILLLPLAGYLSYKFGAQTIMRFSIYLNLLGAIPLFYLFKSNIFSVVLTVRICLILFAVLFSAPCYYYFYQKTSAKNRFQTIALANVIGAHLGKSAPLAAYWIYQKTQLIISPALPVLGLGVLALYFLKEKNAQTVLDTQLS